MGIRLTGFSTPVIGAEWEYMDKKNTVEETTPSLRIESSHKIKVFISSQYGDNGKYDRVRSQLKKTIEETGLAYVYTFEQEAASTLTVGKHFSWGLEDSDLCIFLIDNEAPYNELERNVCRAALIRFLPDRKSENKGFHVTRRTFATGLLMGNAKVELISDSLGHSTDSTVHKYLSLDDERMRLCPLSLEETGISWKGGAFHA